MNKQDNINATNINATHAGKYFKLFFIFSFIFIATSCSQNIQTYKQHTPELALDQFFTGNLVAYGMVTDYSGTVTRRFKADITGYWQGDKGVLDETFYFDDGEQQKRCWRLDKNGNLYTGRATDVVGQASGIVVGNTLNWTYTLNVPVDDTTYNLELDDWLYLIDENNLINKTSMSYWGLNVGDVTLHIRKLQTESLQLSANCQF